MMSHYDMSRPDDLRSANHSSTNTLGSDASHPNDLQSTNYSVRNKFKDDTLCPDDLRNTTNELVIFRVFFFFSIKFI